MDIEIAVGFTHATTIDNGYWYQKGFEHDLKLNSPSFSVGISQPFLDRYRFRAGYEWLGRFTSSALAISDEDYNKSTHGCNGPCPTPQHWYGAGTVQGVYIGLSRELFSIGRTPVAIELGGDYYRSTWEMHIPDWLSSANAQPIDLRVSHRAQWQFTPQIGISLGLIAFSYRKDISADGDQYPAIYKGSAWSLEYRWRF